MSGHFQNDWVEHPILDHQIYLEIEFPEYKIGFGFGENGRPKRASKLNIYIPSEKITVKNHVGMWDPSKNKRKKVKQKYKKKHCQNY